MTVIGSKPKEKSRVLMCPPKYFEIFYSINPHMERTLNAGKKVNRKAANRQWSALRDIYINAGYECVYIEPKPKLPDMVFTANGALVHNDIVVIGKFNNSERQGEAEHFRNWFINEEYTVATIPYFFEGAGDALIWKDFLVGAHGFRSEELGIMAAALYVEKKLVPLRLMDPHFYHLDTCFCPLGDLALFYPHAFDKHSIKELEQVGELIEVGTKDAFDFVCNGSPIETASGLKLIVNKISRKLNKRLEKQGIEIMINGTSEFMKAGGSNRCLSCFLNLSVLYLNQLF